MSQRRTHNSQPKKGGTGATGSAGQIQLQTLSEMFPDWEVDDLTSLLGEHHDDVEIVIDLIVNNKVSKWEPIKKEPRPKKKDEALQDTANHNNTMHHSEHGTNKVRSHKEKSRTDRRRERKPASSRKDHSASTTTSATPASASVSTNAQPSQGPLNSWAAALGKEKAKAKPSSKQNSSSSTSNTEFEKLSETRAAHQNGDDKSTIGSMPAHASERSSSSETSQAVQAAQAATIAAALESSHLSDNKNFTSWASAIKPKAKPPAKKVESFDSEAIEKGDEFEQTEVADPGFEASAGTISPQQDDPEPQTIPEQEAEVQPEERQNQVNVNPSSVKESEVVLPQQVNNIGVSFGSLSLEPKDTDKNTANETESISNSGGDVSQATQKPQDLSNFSSGGQTAPSNDQSQQGVTQSKLGQQEAYQAPYDRQKAGPTQGYDYYSQFQQAQQQFPQQAAGAIPGQFGYPGFDYSAAYGQLGQAGLGSMSPAFYQTVINTNANPKTSAASGNNNATEIAQSPLIAGSTINQHQGLQQQTQQIPSTAPFGYPNPYSYYYNTPFYGNGAGLGTTAGGFGMQHQLSENATGSGNVQGDTDSVNAQNVDAHGIAATNQFYAAQYYGTPSQFGTRAGYPFGGYPASQPFPLTGSQSGEAGETSQQQQQQQPQHQQQHPQSQQQSLGPGQQLIPQAHAGPIPTAMPQYPQQMPQYGAYQQFPQYGGYQDNNQYRGWY